MARRESATLPDCAVFFTPRGAPRVKGGGARADLINTPLSRRTLMSPPRRRHRVHLPALTLLLAGLCLPPAAIPEDAPAAAIPEHTPEPVAAPKAAAAAENPLIVNLSAGRAQWLEAAGERFLGLYADADSGEPQGGIILLHGLGTHPDWPAVIYPLRSALPSQGWATLSIELPAPRQNANREWELKPIFETGAARIEAAALFLEQQGLRNIVVIGHDLGGAVAANALAGVKGGKIKAFVAVGLGLPPHSAAGPYQPALFEQIDVPVLDIYGSRDMDSVMQQAGARARAARKGGAAAYRSQQLDPLKRSATARIPMSEQSGYIAYRQIEITGADHNFTGSEALLIKRITGWLKKHAAGAAVRDKRLSPS